jgi:hypothetical protein
MSITPFRTQNNDAPSFQSGQGHSYQPARSMFGTQEQNPSSRTHYQTRDGQLRPKSKVWLNPGLFVQTQEGPQWIPLPLGLGIDTMEPMQVRGQNVDFIKRANASNQLLADLKNAGNRLAPGEELQIPLTLILRRNNEDLDIQPSDNEYVIDFNSLLKSANFPPANDTPAE